MPLLGEPAQPHVRQRRRTSFSASPCHLEVSEEAEMAKKVARASAASAFASSVLPLPARGHSVCQLLQDNLLICAQIQHQLQGRHSGFGISWRPETHRQSGEQSLIWLLC